ncbi:DNA polymerase III subunit delta' [Chryseobacterium sp. POL2]|uniref:DNA polymerase III subunit n=1 Tax=Chryseobacterium sp. POL2 TaxID=2713414 RepID=UPI0013E1BAEC|nr:DNA polymerase III subunit delta' [Chryseobacterium sp. POL2]QIG88270.1 DNA polymerase III subunit delta' [Chryseobacterium sp. POL2]
MKWEKIVGQEKLKHQLLSSINDNRVGHAQLFVGEEGYGTLAMALAFSQEILSRENPLAVQKVEHLNHLDLHFSFPIFTEKNISLSKRYFTEWREMILANPYSSFDDWTNYLDSEKKQFFISAQEAEDMHTKFALKSFEGGSKILIIWRADKMNEEAANKILKFLEEPPKNTYIILCANRIDTILPTILSRCQMLEVPRIEDEDIKNELIKRFPNQEESSIDTVVGQSRGDLNIASKILEAGTSANEFEELFIQWVRNAFMAKKKPEVLRAIIRWSHEISAWNRDKQIRFLEFCTETFRLALLQNYASPNLVYRKLDSNGFGWDAFSTYISGANIEAILEELTDASYHISRNANAKVVLTDMGIKLTRHIHKKHT